MHFGVGAIFRRNTRERFTFTERSAMDVCVSRLFICWIPCHLQYMKQTFNFPISLSASGSLSETDVSPQRKSMAPLYHFRPEFLSSVSVYRDLREHDEIRYGGSDFTLSRNIFTGDENPRGESITFLTRIYIATRFFIRALAISDRPVSQFLFSWLAKKQKQKSCQWPILLIRFGGWNVNFIFSKPQEPHHLRDGASRFVNNRDKILNKYIFTNPW